MYLESFANICQTRSLQSRQPASHIKIPEEDNRKHRPKRYAYQIVRASDFTVSMIPLGKEETATQSCHKNEYSCFHI
jgi:hypothetical protein